MDMFEQAVRRKLRFETSKGALSVEDLFDLPLTSSTGKPNLDALAVGLNKEANDSSAISFVDEVATANEEAKLKFDIVLHVIAVKKAERKAAADRAANAEKRRRILELIAAKDDEALAAKSKDELLAMVNSLG